MTSSALAPGAPPPAETSSHGQDVATALAPMAARPGDERFLAHLATAGELVAASRFREAEVEVLRALSGLPADLRALNLLALVRVKLGRLEEARSTYREIAAAAPNDATAHRNLGLLALKLEHVEEAIPELEMAARLAPGDKQAWSYLGYAYAKRGQTVPAAAAFRRAGQDALADELEHAVTARRPPSGPKLAALQPSGATPPPAAPPVGFEAGARGGTPAPARSPSGVKEDATVPPSSGVTSPPSGLGEAPRTIAATPSMVVVDAIAPVRAAAEAPAVAAKASEPPSAAPVRAAAEAPAVAAKASAPAPVAPEAPAGPGTLEGDAAPVELAAVPLLGFVLARLGAGVSPPAPCGEALRMGVEDEAFVRSGAALAAVGVRFEPAFRRTQGRSNGEPLAPEGEPFFRLVGQGDVWVAGAPGAWQALALEDDILYVREDRVLAFDGGVSWEAGAVPGDGLRMLQFRGRGCVVLRLDAPPVAVKVTEDRPAYVARDRLLGWVGRLVPHKLRAGGPAPFDLSCQGEGVVLFDLDGDPERIPVPPGARSGRRTRPPLG
jgi:Flp pilus assembly protein TadD/uncharacterized protein (AIM24 family)